MHKKDKIRRINGITLVSLVVTIIVLIILAGVSLNLTLGENGIITMAKRARENMELAKVDEERQLNELYEQIVVEGGLSGNISDDSIIRLVQFKREIASAISDMGIYTPENADASTMSNNIRSILGTATADKLNYDNTNSGLTSTNLQGAVDELDSEIDNINNNLEELSNLSISEWTTLYSGVGTTFIDLANIDYKELMVTSICPHPSNSEVLYIEKLLIHKEEATYTPNKILCFQTGDHSNAQGSRLTANIKNNQIHGLYQMNFSGVDLTSSTTFIVKYR